jgi:phage tail-like protein
MPTPAIRHVARLGLAPRFVVAVDGIDLGGWSKCEGLSVTFKLYDYDPLGHNGYRPILPDRLLYDHIKLTRAVNDVDTPQVMAWLAKRAAGSADGTGGIQLLGTDGQKVMQWNLRGVYPAKWTGPGMDASKKEIATEILELAHEGFLEA